MRRALAIQAVLVLTLVALSGALPAAAQESEDEPVGWPLPKAAGRKAADPKERAPLLPVAPKPQPRRTPPHEEKISVPAQTGAAAGGGTAERAPQPPAGQAEGAAQAGDDAADLVPLERVRLGAEPLVFSFPPDEVALTSEEVRRLERFATAVRSANGVVDILVWVPPPAEDDAKARRAALERAFARGLYLRALLRDAGIPAARIDLLAALRGPPEEKEMPKPPPAEGARIRLVSDFMTGVR